MKFTRRTFLQQTAAASAGLYFHSSIPARAAANPKIKSIETFPLIYPTIGRFKFFEGPSGRPSGRPAVVVKITADNGAVGWGQSVPVPKWTPQDEEQVRFEQYAIHMAALRKEQEAELLAMDASDQG